MSDKDLMRIEYLIMKQRYSILSTRILNYDVGLVTDEPVAIGLLRAEQFHLCKYLQCLEFHAEQEGFNIGSDSKTETIY